MYIGFFNYLRVEQTNDFTKRLLRIDTKILFGDE
jgi:hypothetical protein